MESSLLNLEQGDDETINSIFRAAHSIKGGAGTFGFNHVTEFTHLVETLLDEMRDGRRDISTEDIELLLKSVDCMRLLIESVRDEQDYDDSVITETAKLLEAALGQQQLNANDAVMSDSSIEQQPTEPLFNKKVWQIEFIPQHHLVQTGNDPLLLFNVLSELGELSVIAHTNDLPALTDFDPEELYLSWTLKLITDVSEDEIKEVFEWVEDECELIITLLTETPIDEVNISLAENTDVNLSQNNQLSLSEARVQENEVKAEVDTETLTTIPNSIETSTPVNTVAPLANPIKPNSEKTTKPKVETSSIRVGVDKVDNLINLVGELVITQSMLSELGQDFDITKVERLTSGLEQLLQNTKELQESVMRIRMLPISFAFNRFPRLIHDLALKTGKEIELILKGEQTELDKTVMEQIGDPLVHLVRNAVDHGIEPKEVRLANNKPEKGTIVLNAYHQGGNIVIEIKDDGGGIDRQAVFNKAVEKA